ncbi:hypothetical protein CKAH01_01419 [Colletotrichum kahawae]|uniref:Uncharacterized protein n=1 Tax=Colletotrichum kahawae TaxID=34407 RepID=A0AAD9Y790_COLKA|nr:hypothetical protein CKAH01_01419 [Colletotrichum kahawae]
MRETSRDRTAANGENEERTERRERRAWPSEGGNVETLIGYGTGGQAGPGQAASIWANRRPPAPNGSSFISQVRSLVRDGGDLRWRRIGALARPPARSPARSLSASRQGGRPSRVESAGRLSLSLVLARQKMHGGGQERVGDSDGDRGVWPRGESVGQGP